MSTTNFAVAINNIATTVATAYTAGSGKLYVASTTGITLTGSQWVRVSTFRSGSPLSILKATAVGSDGGGSYLTITGGIDGYTDVNLLVGDAAELRVTAGAFNDLATAVNNMENASNLPVFVASGASHAKGAVPDPGSSAGTTKYLREDATWDVPPGSGGSDMLSVLVNTSVSVTGTTPLSSSAFGKMHVCSGTSSNYTVTLPSPTGNAGKFIGFRMDPGLTKLVTIAQNVSENIDGASSRIMWAKETAILGTDGTTWYKIAGKSIPMLCQLAMYNGDNHFTIATASSTVIPVDSTNFDNTGQMADTANNRINLVRQGIYLISGAVSYTGLSAPSGNTQAAVLRNTVTEALASEYAPTGGGPTIECFYVTTLGAVGDHIQLQGYQNSGSNATVIRSVYSTNPAPYPDVFITNLLVAEKVSW